MIAGIFVDKKPSLLKHILYLHHYEKKIASVKIGVMEALDIRATNDTPKVLLDPENDIFEISGRSLPEDVVDFYLPVIDWLEEYKESPNEFTEFVFKYNYFNTATSKLIQDVLFKLEEIAEAGHKIQVVWFYEEDDEDIMELGEEFCENVDIPFEIISF